MTLTCMLLMYGAETVASVLTSLHVPRIESQFRQHQTYLEQYQPWIIQRQRLIISSMLCKPKERQFSMHTCSTRLLKINDRSIRITRLWKQRESLDRLVKLIQKPLQRRLSREANQFSNNCQRKQQYLLTTSMHSYSLCLKRARLEYRPSNLVQSRHMQRLNVLRLLYYVRC